MSCVSQYESKMSFVFSAQFEKADCTVISSIALFWLTVLSNTLLEAPIKELFCQNFKYTCANQIW